MEKKSRLFRNTIGLFLLSGGLPASLEMTGEQWDRPNAWPPLQIIVIQGLEKMGVPAAAMAKEMARNWLHSNFKGFQDNKEMFEKVRQQKNNPSCFVIVKRVFKLYNSPILLLKFSSAIFNRQNLSAILFENFVCPLIHKIMKLKNFPLFFDWRNFPAILKL